VLVAKVVVGMSDGVEDATGIERLRHIRFGLTDLGRFFSSLFSILFRKCATLLTSNVSRSNCLIIFGGEDYFAFRAELSIGQFNVTQPKRWNSSTDQ